MTTIYGMVSQEIYILKFRPTEIASSGLKMEIPLQTTPSPKHCLIGVVTVILILLGTSIN